MKRWKLITLVSVGAFVVLAFLTIVSGVLPYRVFIVHTGSMSPTIPSTSAVIVRVGEYRVGEPISFEEQGTVITHRLVAINSDGTIVTRGDANATDDPWHPRTSAIIGGVFAAPDHVGYWLMYLRNPAGLASILLAALTCWLIWSFAGAAGQTSDGRAPRPIRKHAATAIRHGRHGSPVASAGSST